MIVQHRAGIDHIQSGVQELRHGALQAQLESQHHASRQLHMTHELTNEVKALGDSTACSTTRLDSISSAMSSIALGHEHTGSRRAGDEVHIHLSDRDSKLAAEDTADEYTDLLAAASITK